MSLLTTQSAFKQRGRVRGSWGLWLDAVLFGGRSVAFRRYPSNPLGTRSITSRCTTLPRLGTTRGTARTLPIGSPPCAWGQRQQIGWWRCWLRFTPMCMGTTKYDRLIGRVDAGSPPCAWGQRLAELRGNEVLRFTPMCMGTTVSRDSCPYCPFGSPPCAWGQR